MAFCLQAIHASFVSSVQVQSCEPCPTTAGAAMWCLPREATRKPFCHGLTMASHSRQPNKLRDSVQEIVAINHNCAANISRLALPRSGIINIVY